MILLNQYKQMHRVRLTQTMQLAVAVIVILSFGYVSHAQTDLRQAQSSIFPRRSVKAFVETRLDRDTASEVMARYEVYAQTHAEGWQERWAEVSRPPQHTNRHDGLRRNIHRRLVTSDWNRARRALFNAFVDDVRGMLESEDAADAWDREVRLARIADWVRELDPQGGGRLAKRDPFMYLEEVDVPAVLEGPIANLREVYELDMAAAVRRLERDFDRISDQLMRMRVDAEIAAIDAGERGQGQSSVSTNDFLGSEYYRVYEQRTALIDRISDVIVKTRREIVATLPEPQRTQYENAWFCGVLPQRCVPSPVDLILEQLLEDASIDVSLRQALDAIGADYERDRIKLRRELMDAFDVWRSPEMEALRAEEEARLVEEGEHPYLARALHPASDVLRKMVEREREFTIRIERALLDAGRPDSSCNARVRVLLKWHKVPQ